MRSDYPEMQNLSGKSFSSFDLSLILSFITLCGIMFIDARNNKEARLINRLEGAK